MARVKIALNRAGVREAALTSPQVRAAVSGVARRIAAAAESRNQAVGDESEAGEIVVDDGGRSRARSYVRALGPAAAAREAKYRILGSAIDAGRS